MPCTYCHDCVTKLNEHGVCPDCSTRWTEDSHRRHASQVTSCQFTLLLREVRSLKEIIGHIVMGGRSLEEKQLDAGDAQRRREPASMSEPRNMGHDPSNPVSADPSPKDEVVSAWIPGAAFSLGEPEITALERVKQGRGESVRVEATNTTFAFFSSRRSEPSCQKAADAIQKAMSPAVQP